MKPKSRSLFLILFGIPLALMIPVVLVGSTVFQAGSIEVLVQEKNGGCSVDASIPAAIVPVAMRFVPAHVLDEVRCEVRAEGGYGLDIARAALRELSRCPDGILVDVQTRSEIVTVEKRDGALRVYVDTPDERVQASFPLHTANSVLSII